MTIWFITHVDGAISALGPLSTRIRGRRVAYELNIQDKNGFERDPDVIHCDNLT